jgi:uncharacterized protein (DUF488 family)
VAQPDPHTLFTVGHSTLPIAEFLALLRQGLVTAVADVRRYPGSKRNPQFGAESLAGSLAAAGIDYVSFGNQLGGRRKPAARSAAREPGAVDNSAWRHPSFRAYADYMSTAEFAAGLGRLEELAAGRRTAIMCAEAHPSRCHRRLIADAMLARDWRVFHLLQGRAPEPHALSEHAVLDGTQVSYPQRQTSLEG